MAAIYISGYNASEALTGACTDARHIMETVTGGAPDFDGDGRVFELLHLHVENSHDASQVELHLYDANEGSQPSTNVQIGGPIIVGPNSVVEKTWARGTGPKFRTNIVAGTSRLLTQGQVRIGGVYCAGLLH